MRRDLSPLCHTSAAISGANHLLEQLHRMLMGHQLRAGTFTIRPACPASVERVPSSPLAPEVSNLAM